MGDVIVAAGDLVMFEPTFGNRLLVAPPPGVLKGTAGFTVSGKPACLVSDLLAVIVPGVSYTAGNFTVPGMGIIRVVAAGADQKAIKVSSGGTEELIKGSECSATFTPVAPATDPSSGAPDVMTATQGKGRFMVMNVKVKAN